MPFIKTINYNIPNKQGNVPLHTAVRWFDQGLLDNLLQQRDIDVNYKNIDGDTPLLLCSKLTKDMYPISTRSQSNLATWLQRRCDIAHKLIENGADINARDRNGYTALHYAVINKHLEAVCMLLYYGIDVSILCDARETAFNNAVSSNKLNLAEVLFDYYDDFSNSDLRGFTALYWAASYGSPLAVKLVEAGADVNCVTNQGSTVLQLSLFHNNAELFKLIWPKFDYLLLLEDSEPFVERFITYTTRFPVSEWVECMYLILESPVAFDLLDHYKSVDYYLPHWRGFSLLLYKLSKLKVKPSDRINIIAACLSLGLEASKDDINMAFTLYGFGKELELFIYGTDILDRLNSSDTFLNLLPRCIFTQENELGFEEIISLLNRQLVEYYDYPNQTMMQEFLYSLGFFALPFHWRSQLQLYRDDGDLFFVQINQVIRDKLNNVPEVPSLLELARNKTRQYIKQSYRVYRPYHMLDAVKSLNLPQRVQDIIILKKPVYG